MKTEFDVFLSYRRTGFDTANLIATKLKNMGYSVFFDVESLRSGKFNEQLFGVIEKCKDFVVVLPPDALDRCMDEDDWVRKEVCYGMQCGKNIIPVMLNGFVWPEPMPDGMEQLRNYQAVTATSNEFFDMSIKRLSSYFKSKPHNFKLLKKIGFGILLITVMISILYAIASVVAKPVANRVGTYLSGSADMMYGLYEDVMQVDEAWRIYCMAYQGANTEEFRMAKKEDLLSRLSILSQDVSAIRKSIPKSPELSDAQGSLMIIYMIPKEEIECTSKTLELTCDEVDSIISTVRRFGMAENMDAFYYKYITYMIEEFKCEANGSYYYYMAEMSLLPKSAREEHYQLSDRWTHFPSVSLSLPLDELLELGNKEYDKASKITERMGILVEKEDNRLDNIERSLDTLANAIMN